MRLVSFTVLAALSLCAIGMAQEIPPPVPVPAPVADSYPVIQARDVYAKNGREYVGRALTLELPKDKDGLKYFYSILQPLRRGVVVTTVESWTDEANRPIKAVYKTNSVSTVFEFFPDKVKISKITPQTTKRTEVKLQEGTIAVMSQFNPFDYAGKDLLVFDPNFDRGIAHSVVLQGTNKAGDRQYRVSSSMGWNEILTTSEGHFRSMDNSEGLVMKTIDLMPHEIQHLTKVLQTATR